MKLPVPHFRQQLPHTCLPACVRMVLAYWGKEHSEVVVIGIEGERVTCLDPSLDREFSFELSSFLRAWSNPRRQGLIVWV